VGAINDLEQSFNMTADAVLSHLYSDVPKVGKSGKVFTGGPALSTKRNLREIEDLLRQSRPANTLEVGMALGGSSLIFASVGREVHGDYHHVAIDPFQSTVWDRVGVQSLESAGLINHVQVVEKPSSLVLPRLLEEGRQFGLIYVDGSHLFEDVFLDAYFSARLLTEHGYLLLDDAANGHVAKVVRFIERNMTSLERMPERSWRHRVARLAGKRQLAAYRRAGPVERSWDSRFNAF
jgi:predicted O-methyltransferase YrrM